MKKTKLAINTFFLFLLPFMAFAQCDYNYCNMIENSTLTGKDTGASGGPFVYGKVPGWQRITGAPRITAINRSTPTAAKLTATSNFPSCLYGSAIGQKVLLKKGYVYWIVFYARDSSSTASYYPDVRFTNAYIPPTGWQYDSSLCGSLMGMDTADYQLAYRKSSRLSTKWTKISMCFTASKNWTMLVINPNAKITMAPNIYNTLIDNVKLYEIHPCLGNDTTICTFPVDSLKIGFPACKDTLDGNYPTFSNPSSYDPDSSWFWVHPGGAGSTYTYRLHMTGGSCTVTTPIHICVSERPDDYFGDDTTICAGSTIYWFAHGSKPSYTYKWSYMGYTTSSITIPNAQEGWYKLVVTAPCGCKDSDSVYVNVLPHIKITPHDTTICTGDSATLCATDSPGYSYLWNTGATTPCITVHTARQYTCRVCYVLPGSGDELCCKTDTARVRVFSPPGHFHIGPSKTICLGESVTFKAPDGKGYRYKWSTGDTTRIITVSPIVTTTYQARDSAGSCSSVSNIDTIMVCTPPAITFSSAPCICPGSGPQYLNTLLSPSPGGGSWKDSGAVSGGVFYPALAAPGWNRVTYCTTDTCNYTPAKFHHTCHACAVDSIKIDTVAGLAPIGTLCSSGPYVILQGTPAGGTYSGAPGIVGNTLDPSIAGPGTYTITYTYTSPSPCNCTSSASQKVLIVPQPDFNLEFVTDTAGLCEGEPVVIIASYSGDLVPPPPLDAYTYSWSNNSNDSLVDTVYTDNTYHLNVSVDGVCPEVFHITLNLRNCCAATADVIGNDTISTNTTWTSSMGHSNFLVNGTIFVTNGATLTVDNLNVYMQNCSDILVDRGSTLQVLDNSHIGFCNWHGIEVWGDIDNCAADSIHAQGVLDMQNSTLDHADIGVFAGTRGISPIFLWKYGSPSIKIAGGGILNIDHSVFDSNYIDIMYSERDAGGICDIRLCSFGSPGWYGYVWYNTFNQNKLFSNVCGDDDTLLISALVNYGGFCSIVDMNLSPWVWSYPWSGGGINYCGTIFYSIPSGPLINCASYPEMTLSPIATPPYIFNNNTWPYLTPISPNSCSGTANYH